jgi:hypothetical protein
LLASGLAQDSTKLKLASQFLQGGLWARGLVQNSTPTSSLSKATWCIS